MKIRNVVLAFVALFVCSTGQSQVSGVNIIKSGKGRPVIFLPGFVTPGSVWNETLLRNKKTENHVATYAGFNSLPAVDTPWYSKVKEGLTDYILREKLTDVILVGHSMGGNLAIDLAADHPGAIAKVILVDAIPCMRELMMPGVPVENIVYNNPYSNQMLQMKPEAFRQLAVMMASNMAMDKNAIDSLVHWMEIADRKTYVYGYTDLLKLDQRSTLEEIQADVLILGATFPTKEIAEAVFNSQYVKLKNKKIVMADNSKHFIMLDQPDWFYKQVNDFLDR